MKPFSQVSVTQVCFRQNYAQISLWRFLEARRVEAAVEPWWFLEVALCWGDGSSGQEANGDMVTFSC